MAYFAAFLGSGSVPTLEADQQGAPIRANSLKGQPISAGLLTMLAIASRKELGVDGPEPTLIAGTRCCSAARHTRHSLQAHGQG